MSSDTFESEIAIVLSCYGLNDDHDAENLQITSTTVRIETPLDYNQFIEEIEGTELEDTDDSDSDTTVEINMSLEDVEEARSVASMFATDAPPCCTRKCNKTLEESMVTKTRDSFHELSKLEQDLVVLAHFEFHRQDLSLGQVYAAATRKKYGSRAHTNKSRIDMSYSFRDVSICKKMFLFIHDMGNDRYKALIKHFDEMGLVSRKHGLQGKPAYRKTKNLTPELLQKIVDFVKNFAAQVSIPLPGRLPNVKDFKMVKLPSSETKMSVYRRYIAACEEEKTEKISRSLFYKLWAQYCPFILTMKPASDLCDICQQNSLIVQRSLLEDDLDTKEGKFRLILDHLERAKLQRTFYQESCLKSQEADNGTILVLSFDYAQNISYPYRPQQTGSSYFKAGRKCSIFGIHNEHTHIQTNILNDEQYDAGKGPNTVISQLDHYLQLHKADHLILFCDNCVAQNKNNTMLHYLSWRIKSAMNKSITLNFLLTGHTKFSPDRLFGVLKHAFLRSIIDCYDDFENCVKHSSPNGFNEAINGKHVQYRAWDTFFRETYRKLPGKWNELRNEYRTLAVINFQ